MILIKYRRNVIRALAITRSGYTLTQLIFVVAIIAAISTVVFPVLATPPQSINLFDRYYHPGMPKSSVYALMLRLSDEQQSEGSYDAAFDYFRIWSEATSDAYVKQANPDTPYVITVCFHRSLTQTDANTQARYFYSCFSDVRHRFMPKEEARRCIVLIVDDRGKMISIGAPGAKNKRINF